MKSTRGIAKDILCRWRCCSLGILIALVSTSFLAVAISQEKIALHQGKRDFWLNTNERDFLEDLNWLEQENQLYHEAGVRAPWVGVRFKTQWGLIQLSADEYDFQDILALLDKADDRGFKVALTISDKLWSFAPNYPYQGAPIPKHLDIGPLGEEEFTLYERTLGDGKRKDAWYEGEFIHARNEFIIRKNTYVKKYFAKRWKLEADWKEFWTATAKSIGKHPALAAIVTPESSIGFAGPNSQTPPWKFEYPGGRQYADYLIRQAKFMRELFPPNVAIANNVNWITPDIEAHHSRVATEVAKLETCWWVQDLSDIFSKYPRYVYPQVEKFPRERRWGVISGESHRGQLSADNILEMADEMDFGNLVFFPKRNTPGHQQVFELLRRRIKPLNQSHHPLSHENPTTIDDEDSSI